MNEIYKANYFGLEKSENKVSEYILAKCIFLWTLIFVFVPSEDKCYDQLQFPQPSKG